MNPPRLPLLLLRLVAGKQDAEYIAGDLFEEFCVLRATNGPEAARRWYASQAIRSLFALSAQRLKKSGTPWAMLAAALNLAWAMFVLDRLWAFVYSLIPLKDGLDRAPGFLAVNLVCACAISAVCGAESTSRRMTAGIAAAVTAAAGFSLWISAGAAPPGYVFLLLAAPPAAVSIARGWRRIGLRKRLP